MRQQTLTLLVFILYCDKCRKSTTDKVITFSLGLAIIMDLIDIASKHIF